MMKMNHNQTARYPSRFWFVFVLLGLTLSGCFKKYGPADLDRFRDHGCGFELTFETEDGRQSAFYCLPADTSLKCPRDLVIVYPGYASTALDWIPFVRDYPKEDTGFLLLDYPGMGNNEGMYRPRNLPRTSRGAIKALCDHFHTELDSLSTGLILFGHSFGCGAALQFAPEINVKRVVLIAPFTTLMRAFVRKMGPVAWIMPDRMDNRKRLADLYVKSPRPGVTIIHGSRDRSIPGEHGTPSGRAFPRMDPLYRGRGCGPCGYLPGPAGAGV